MRLACSILLSLVLTFPTLAQNKTCVDLSCLVYLLATDPTQPDVARYIEENNGQVFKKGESNNENAAFLVFTKEMPTNAYEAGADRRELVDRISVSGEQAIKEALTEIGYPYDYEALKSVHPDKYVKVKKKHTGVDISIGFSWSTSAKAGDFSDCWNGSISYRRNGQGVIEASSLQLSLLNKEDAIKYNPLGWHTKNLLTECETGDCTVCNIGKLAELKGVSVEEQAGYREDIITIDVQSTDIELPLGLSKEIRYNELLALYGFDYPWKLEEGVFSYPTAKGALKFHFENDVLTKIVAKGVDCTDDFAPVPISVTENIRIGGATPDSPALVDYSGGYTYIGEMKNGVPHGFGALVSPDNIEGNIPVKVISPNQFEHGKPTTKGEMDKPICISDDCADKGMVLTNQGVYQGELKDGLPHGYGVLLYTYSSWLQRYEGNFENGQGASSEGKIEYHNGNYYIGAVANSVPNGNGRMYNKYNTIVSSGWYEDGYVKERPKTDENEKVTRFKFDPSELSLKEYLSNAVASLKLVSDNEVFVAAGKNFETGALQCGKFPGSTNELYSCVSSNRIKYTGKTVTAISMVDDLWTEVLKAIGTPFCWKDGGTESMNAAMNESKRLYKLYRDHTNNMDPYYEAMLERLNTNAAQNDLDFGKEIFSGVVSNIRSNYSYAGKLYKDFSDSVIKLQKVLLDYSCIE